jgi:serine/threonine protein kinase
MSSVCPDANTLGQLASGVLDEATRRTVLAHLDECEQCRRVVVLAVEARHDEPSARTSEAPLRPGTRIGRYVIEHALGAGAMGHVYAAHDERLGRSVAMKLARRADGWDAENLFRLKHEFRSRANLEHENIVRFVELACEDGQWFFTMERVYGDDFLAYVEGPRRPAGPLEAASEQRLRDALGQLVEGVAALHEAGRIHRDIKPSNVLVTAEGRVVLLDFGLMTGFDAKEGLHGTPAFMAPEQIAGDKLTPAADWYAVGGMLFAALTGKLPFEGDAGKVLHRKLTEAAPADCGSATPDDLRTLCMDLLRREPGERPDLQQIRARLGRATSSRAPVREVFVGRERELESLRDALAKTESGAGAAVVVRGEPGIGKSALVEQLLSGVPPHSVVLRGRCYEQENVPFSGADSLVDALSELLLGADAGEVDRWIAGGVSNVARVFPVLCRVPAIAALAGVHGGSGVPVPMLRARAFGELASLVGALGQSRRLVVFLDDLQWLDADSLALVRAAFLSGTRCSFVATLRSGGVLSPELAEFVAGVAVVELSRLTSGESLALWHALGATGDAAVRDAILNEAAGHPFLLAELLRAPGASRRAQGDATRLEDVLWERISRRDDVERRFLEMSAIAAAPTAYTALAHAAGVDVGDCLTRLSALRAAQLVRVSRVDGERCVEPYHDRVRDAIVSRLLAGGTERIERLHLALGRALLVQSPESHASRIFAIVQHLNAGVSRIESEQERRELAALNLLASNEAARATAFDRARGYARAGIDCLPADAWSSDPATWRDLHVARFVSEHVTLGREAARATFDTVKARVPTLADKAALYVVWIELEGATMASIEAAREILGELGSPPPASVGKLHVLVEYARARRAQRGRAAAAFETAPELRHDATQRELRILAALIPAAFYCDPNLFPWILLRIARISMTMGVSEASPIGFVGLGVVRAGAFHDYVEGAAFGRLAVSLARARSNSRVLVLTHFMNAFFLQSWIRPWEDTRADASSIERLARASGETHHECYAMAVSTEVAFYAGREVRAVVEGAKRLEDHARRYGMREMVFDCNAFARYGTSLDGSAPEVTRMERPDPDEGEFVSGLSGPGRLRYHYLRAELAYLAHAGAAEIDRHLVEVKRWSSTSFAVQISVEIRFLRALVAARAWSSASSPMRARHVLRVARAVRRLDAWARLFPPNFEAHALVVRAELQRLLGRAVAASATYERAIASARKYGAVKREAIACELAAAHASSRGTGTEAESYRRLAIDAYRRWGAAAKVRMLEQPVSENRP